MSISGDLIEGVKDNLPVKEAYSDALSPAMKQVGGILESGIKAARFVFAPLEYIAAYQDRFQRYLKTISERVPEEKLVEGHPQVVEPIVAGLIKSYEGSLLSEMFIELLAKALNADHQDYAHPSFPMIVNQLSHDEAVILYLLKKQHINVHEKLQINDALNTSYGRENILDDFPYDKLSFPAQFDATFYHLKGLSLVEDRPVDITYEFNEHRVRTASIEKYHRELTIFGKLFADACVPDEFPGL